MNDPTWGCGRMLVREIADKTARVAQDITYAKNFTGGSSAADNEAWAREYDAAKLAETAEVKGSEALLWGAGKMVAKGAGWVAAAGAAAAVLSGAPVMALGLAAGAALAFVGAKKCGDCFNEKLDDLKAGAMDAVKMLEGAVSFRERLPAYQRARGEYADAAPKTGPTAKGP